ncbi:hypothetical protein O181_028009 [Austropuccinia psidii MF-1]|uniref:Uncharacterized protein n=1 Tax=Austropuccinia psidii MF-1 TaxID=1389203 RepID=A0A9Q3CN22_9BASI|nr:hypothetical protein [Austropuccinia psidii MF-1]
MSHLRQDNVTQSRNPFNTIYKDWVITPHDARQNFGMRRLPPSHPFTMPTLTHELASTSLPNPLQPLAFLHARTTSRCDSNTAPPSPPSSILTFPWRPQDIPPTPPSTLLMPLLCHLPCLCSRSALPTCLQRRLPSLPPPILMLLGALKDETTMPPPISSLTTPYASAPLPLTILTLLWRPKDMPPMPPSIPLHLILSPLLTILTLSN